MKESITTDKEVVYVYFPYLSYSSTGAFQNTTLIYVNDQKVARLGDGMYTRIVVTPGKYRFRTSTDRQLACHSKFFQDFTWAPVDLEVERNKVYFLRYSEDDYSMSERIAAPCQRRLLKINYEEALVQIRDAKYVIPKEEFYSETNSPSDTPLLRNK